MRQLNNLDVYGSISLGGSHYPSLVLSYWDSSDIRNVAKVDINAKGIYYYQKNSADYEILATQSYVTSQIQGAINSSY